MRALFFFALYLLFPLQLLAGNQIWNGSITFWKAAICVSGDTTCDPLPKAMAPSTQVSIKIYDIKAPGQYLLVQREFVHQDWKMELIVTRHNSSDPAQKSYLVTQQTLFKDGQGLVARCSRYDAVDAFTFLPPGSCAVAVGPELIGVSLSAH